MGGRSARFEGGSKVGLAVQATEHGRKMTDLSKPGVVTPEAVVLTLETAGLGSRLLARLFDSIIQGLALLGLFLHCLFFDPRIARGKRWLDRACACYVLDLCRSVLIFGGLRNPMSYRSRQSQGQNG